MRSYSESKDMTKFNCRSLLLAVLASLGGGVQADEPGHRHHRFAKDVDAFHAVLAPVWHARPGPERTYNACARAGDMARLARAIRSAEAAPLAASVSALQATCDGNNGEVDAALHDVHEAFHRLIEMKPPAAKG